MKFLDTMKDIFDFSEDFDEDDDDSYLKEMAKIEKKNKERERKERTASGNDDKITSIFSKRSNNTSAAPKRTAQTDVKSAKNKSRSGKTSDANIFSKTKSTEKSVVKSSEVKDSGKSREGSLSALDRREQYNSAKRDSSEISIYNVKNFEDATLVCDKLVNGLPIIVSFDDPNSTTAQRVMDFLAGCIYTINGNLHTISDKIFLFSPEGVDVSGDYMNLVKENSFGVPTFNKMI